MIKKWSTEILAVDPKTGELTSWFGPIITAISLNDAIRYCNENCLGYCKVIGEYFGSGISKEEALENAILYSSVQYN